MPKLPQIAVIGRTAILKQILINKNNNYVSRI